MTVPNNASDVFADALDGSTTGLPDDTEMLLVVVDRLHRLPGSVELADAGARPDFRVRLRDRLLEEAGQEPAEHAKVVPITSRWNQSWGRRNRVRVLSSLAAGVVGLVAVSIAATNSLPGSPFYQLKRGSESVQYALAGSDEARGKLELGFARTRLHEIDRLTEHNAAYGVMPTEEPQAAGGTSILATSVSTTVVGLFADMDSEAAKGSALLAKSFRGDPRPGPLLAVQQFAKDQAAALTTLRGRLAEPALSKATHSLAWAKQVVKSTTAALATCSDSTCPAAAGTQLGGSLAPSLVPSPTPSGQPSALAPPSQTPSPALPSQPLLPTVPASPPAVLPSTAPETPQPTVGQPTATPPPPGQPTSAPPTDVSPTDAPPTPDPTTDPPTPAPTTDPPTSAAPTTLPEPPPSTPVDVPTAPPASLPVETTPPVTADPTTDPPVTVPPTTPAPPTTPDPTTPPPATSAAPTTTVPPTVAPTTTPAPTRTGRPPLICLPPSFLLDGICVHLPFPPGTGAAAH